MSDVIKTCLVGGSFLAIFFCIPTMASPTDDLFHAIKRRNFADAKNAIKQKAILTQKDDQGKTPLHFAAGSSYAKMVSFLLEFGHVRAHIDDLDQDGKTPLWYAAQAGNAAVIDLLLKHGANAQRRQNDYGWMPIHVAAQFGRCAAMTRLCQEDSIDVGDLGKWSPLHVAAFFGSEAGVQCALRLGARTELKTAGKRKKNAQRIAKDQGFDTIFQMITKARIGESVSDVRNVRKQTIGV